MKKINVLMIIFYKGVTWINTDIVSLSDVDSLEKILGDK